MMIQFNLLPDVKIEYLKTRRTKRLVLLGASTVTGIALAIMIGLFIGTNFIQRNHLNNLRSDIDDKSRQLQEEKDLNKILTVQQQLSSLTALHENKPAAERLGQYMSQITPNDVSISNLEVDFEAHTMSFDGGAPSLKAVNQFIDTLKFTTFKQEENTGKAFSSVVLAAFSRSEDTQSKTPATYQITLSYDPIIMDGTKTVALEVPKTTTTRSTTEKPAELFQQSTPDSGGRE